MCCWQARRFALSGAILGAIFGLATYLALPLNFKLSATTTAVKQLQTSAFDHWNFTTAGLDSLTPQKQILQISRELITSAMHKSLNEVADDHNLRTGIEIKPTMAQVIVTRVDNKTMNLTLLGSDKNALDETLKEIISKVNDRTLAELLAIVEARYVIAENYLDQQIALNKFQIDVIQKSANKVQQHQIETLKQAIKNSEMLGLTTPKMPVETTGLNFFSNAYDSMHAEISMYLYGAEILKNKLDSVVNRSEAYEASTLQRLEDLLLNEKKLHFYKDQLQRAFTNNSGLLIASTTSTKLLSPRDFDITIRRVDKKGIIVSLIFISCLTLSVFFSRAFRKSIFGMAS